MGYLGGFLVSFKQQGPKQRVTRSYPEQKRPRPVRLHGRHVLNRYEDGTEKCIGCELCAGVCPAKCIYVRGRDNPVDAPVSPGERWGYVYEINYLRCIHCDLCVEACPTEAITDSKLFEFSFTNRTDAIYSRKELLVDAETGKPQQLPWEDWRPGEDLYTSGWVRATAPSGNAAYENKVAWGGDRGYGVRDPERGQAFEGRGTGPTVMIHPPDDPDAGTRIMALAQREPRTEASYDAEREAEIVEDIVAGRATPTKPSYGISEES